MDRNYMISLLRQSAAAESEQTPFCPDDEELAAFVDRTLPGARRESLEHHLPDCPACIRRVGLITRLTRENEEIPEATSAIARKMILQQAPRWAVAATVLMAVAWLAWAPVDDSETFRATRNIETSLTRPEILAPSSGMLASSDDFVVRWTEVPGSLYYEVRIVSDVGDLLSLERTSEPQWSMGDGVELRPGDEYFIRVDAFLSDSQAIQSDHIPFRLREER
jgi:hypothetical protein